MQSFIGTGLIVGIATVIAVPLGILARIYLAEYGKGRTASAIRVVAYVLLSTPSIVAGAFIWSIVVVFSATSPRSRAGSRLVVLMWPIVTRARRTSSGSSPRSSARGPSPSGSPVEMMLRVVMPTAGAGILTATMLAVARGLGGRRRSCSPPSGTTSSTRTSDAHRCGPVPRVRLRADPGGGAPQHRLGRGLVLLAAVLFLSISARVLSNPPAEEDGVRKVEVSGLKAWFGSKQVLHDINLVRRCRGQSPPSSARPAAASRR